MNAVMPVVLSCGELTAEIGTIEVPLRLKLDSSPISPTKDAAEATVTPDVDMARFGRNLADLLRATAAEFERLGDRTDTETKEDRS